MKLFIILISVYAFIINVYAIALTIHDKRAAKKHRYRVPERRLLLTAALSGCAAMYVTMLIIHHKTRHMKFMIGIPAIFILECAAGAGLWYLIQNEIIIIS